MSVATLTRTYKTMSSFALRRIIAKAQRQISIIQSAGLQNGLAEQSAIFSIQAATNVLTARGAALSLPFIPLPIQSDPKRALLFAGFAAVSIFFLVGKK